MQRKNLKKSTLWFLQTQYIYNSTSSLFPELCQEKKIDTLSDLNLPKIQKKKKKQRKKERWGRAVGVAQNHHKTFNPISLKQKKKKKNTKLNISIIQLFLFPDKLCQEKTRKNDSLWP